MRFRLVAGLSVCAALLMAVSVQAAARSRPAPWPGVILGHGTHPSAHLGAPRFTALPLRGVSPSSLAAQIAAGKTVQTWGASINSGLGGTYSYKMVGKNPMVKQSSATANIGVDVIPVSLKFLDTGTTFDPTKNNSSCLNGSGSANSLFKASPIFNKHSYTVSGKNIGNVQYEDSFQREEYAKYILNSGAINPGYHVNLSPVKFESKVSLTVGTSAGATDSGGCAGKVGVLTINSWDTYLQKTLLPKLEKSGEVKTTQLPVFLFYNVVMSENGTCCVIGYHSAHQANGGVQTYSTTDYVEKGLFSGPLTDLYAASHEVGEWINDPFVNNATPAWGHVGQVSGCQSNLEVGDPLSGQPSVNVKMPNGVTYHAQELAFRDWFYRTPSVGLNGWFSSRGTFKSNAGAVCH